MAGNGSEFLPNYVEHITPLKEKKLIAPKRFLLVFCSTLMILASIFLILAFNALVPIFAALLIIEMYLIWYCSRFVSIEFEYTIQQGEISFDIVYGRQQRKPFYSTPLKNVEVIAPLENGEVPESVLKDVDREVFCASKKESEFTRYAVIREADGKKTLLYFEVMERAEKVLRFYSARAFR